MKVRVALEFTFSGTDNLNPEMVKNAIAEQMEMANMYFTVTSLETGIEVELSPDKIEVLSSAVEVKPPEVTVTIKEFNREMFVKSMEEFISCIRDPYIQSNLEPALRSFKKEEKK